MFKRDLNRTWSKEELQKRRHLSSFDYAGKSIIHVEAKLNKIRVFGHYDSTVLRNKLMPIKADETLPPEKRNRKYEMRVIEEVEDFPDFYLTVFDNRKKPFHPQCSIEIHPKKDIDLETHKAMLIGLNEKLPNLYVSKVEYVIDQFCVDHVGATTLFWLDTRCLHLSYRKRGRIEGEHNTRQDERATGLAYKIGRHHKICERGPESERRREGWLIRDVDRVRLEHRVNRTKLKKYGINTLKDLIENPRFSVINLYRWRFMQFLKLRKLPKFWQPQSTKDQGSHTDVFRLEAIRSMRKTENVSEYISNYNELLRIEFKVNRAMKLFDWNWYNITTH